MIYLQLQFLDDLVFEFRVDDDVARNSFILLIYPLSSTVSFLLEAEEECSSLSVFTGE